MNENEARQTLLVRAFETAPPSPQWGEEDREWATRSAAQIEGESASPDRFIARRAGLASERLGQRVPVIRRQLAALQWRPWLLAAIAVLSLLAGLIIDAVGAGNRINVLAPPILAVLVWNIVVYLTLIAGALRQGLQRTRRGTGTVNEAGQLPGSWLPRWLAGRLSGLAGTGRRHQGPNDRMPLAVFHRHWAVASSGLYGARGMAGLHLAAAMLALGLLASLYLRGLAFEFLASWQSTFLSAPTVASLLQIVLGPAAALTGIALPDLARLEAIRAPTNPGENAAAWIHLYAVTLLIVVVVPRLLLAAWQGWRARRLARSFPIPLGEPYFLDLVRQYRGEAAVIQVLPYSYQVPVDTIRALNRLMQLSYGPSTTVTVAPALQLGAEDRLRDMLHPQVDATLTVALFALTATPEIENHATFIKALRQNLPAGSPLLAVVDEATFRARFGTDSERLVSRRTAWRRILQDGAGIEPVFIALGVDDPSDLRQRLAEVLHQGPGAMVQNDGLAANARITA